MQGEASSRLVMKCLASCAVPCVGPAAAAAQGSLQFLAREAGDVVSSQQVGMQYREEIKVMRRIKDAIQK